MNRNGTNIGSDAVRFERVLPARIDVVWEYLTLRDRVQSWLAVADIEPRMGGTVKLVWERWCVDQDPAEGRPWTTTGVVTKWDPPGLLAYTWSENGNLESEVTFELTPLGEETQLILTHRQLPTAERRNYGAGWHGHLDLLATRLKGGERGEFLKEHEELLKQYS